MGNEKEMKNRDSGDLMCHINGITQLIDSKQLNMIFWTDYLKICYKHHQRSQPGHQLGTNHPTVRWSSTQ